MPKKKTELNFILRRGPGQTSDPLDQLIQFGAEHKCKAKGRALQLSDGRMLCAMDAKLADPDGAFLTWLLTCNYMTGSVKVIRNLKTALDMALTAALADGGGDLDASVCNQALLEANDFLYVLRMHWQASVTREKQLLEIKKLKLRKLES